MCRLDTDDVLCRPEAQLVVDLGPRGIDLCVTGVDRKTHRPRCGAKFAERYLQALFYRMMAPVEAPDGTVTRRMVEVQKTSIGRMESLIRRRPLVRAGPDGCAYARVERRVHPRGPGVGTGPPPRK